MYWLLFEPPGVNILVGGLLLAVDVVVGPDSITNIASARDVIIPSFFAVCLVAANKKKEKYPSYPHWNTFARWSVTKSQRWPFCCCFRETTEYTSAHCDSSG